MIRACRIRHFFLVGAFSVGALCHALAGTPEPAARTLQFVKGISDEKEKAYYKQLIDQSVTNAQADVIPMLLSSDHILVVSLKSGLPQKGKEDVTDDKLFHGYTILGAATLADASDLDAMRKLLIEGITPASQKTCFLPRYGIRIIAKKTALDLVISFECGHMIVFGGKTQLPHYLFDPTANAALNEILDANHVQRDKPKP